MVAERQVEKMQKFVKDYSAKMNEIEEALDESLVRPPPLRVQRRPLSLPRTSLFNAVFVARTH